MPGKMPEGILRPAVLNISEILPLSEQTLMAAHANTLGCMKIRMTKYQDLISDLEHFTLRESAGTLLAQYNQITEKMRDSEFG